MKRTKHPRQRLHVIACERIRALVVRNELAPGSQLTESGLARQLGMSRTPVREALRTLTSEGLVEAGPEGVVRVPAMNLTDFIEVVQLRIAVEGFAARLAAPNIPGPELESLWKRCEAFRGDNRERDVMAGYDLSVAVHDLAARWCPNAYLGRVLGTVRLKANQSRKLAWAAWTGSRYEDVIAYRRFVEHLDIIEAFRQRDGGAAEAAMRRHLANALKDVASAVCEAAAPDTIPDRTRSADDHDHAVDTTVLRRPSD